MLVREEDQERAEVALREIAVARGEMTPEDVELESQDIATEAGRQETPSADVDQQAEDDAEPPSTR